MLVAGHNSFDTIHSHGNSFNSFLWSALHDSTWGKQADQFFIYGRSIIVDYPVMPWMGVFALGYCFGHLSNPTMDSQTRRKRLFILGSTAILLFILLRALNVYGDPQPWAVQKSPAFTVLSFLKVTKYPPSLQFILITLGPAMLFLSVAEKFQKKFLKPVIRFGRVPMFFYLVHIYVLHLLGLFAAKLTGYEWHDMISKKPLIPVINGYGFSLGVVYFTWLMMILLLYPLCKWYDAYKSRHKQWWLSYV